MGRLNFTFARFIGETCMGVAAMAVVSSNETQACFYSSPSKTNEHRSIVQEEFKKFYLNSTEFSVVRMVVVENYGLDRYAPDQGEKNRRAVLRIVETIDGLPVPPAEYKIDHRDNHCRGSFPQAGERELYAIVSYKRGEALNVADLHYAGAF